MRLPAVPRLAQASRFLLYCALSFPQPLCPRAGQAAALRQLTSHVHRDEGLHVRPAPPHSGPNPHYGL